MYIQPHVLLSSFFMQFELIRFLSVGNNIIFLPLFIMRERV